MVEVNKVEFAYTLLVLERLHPSTTAVFPGCYLLCQGLYHMYCVIMQMSTLLGRSKGLHMADIPAAITAMRNRRDDGTDLSIPAANRTLVTQATNGIARK